MSVAYTEDAVRERRKTVTRRKGWLMLKPGDHLTLCRKVMGRKPGEPLVRICEVEVVNVRRESLYEIDVDDSLVWPEEYAAAEIQKEGFGEMNPADFVTKYFVEAQGMARDAEVTRVEFRYLDEEPT